MSKALVQVEANDITPVTLSSEDSNQISQAELALFSLRYASKIKKAVDNPTGGGTKLKGYNALNDINTQVKAATTDHIQVDLENSYAEIVTDGQAVYLDFALQFVAVSAGYTGKNIIIKIPTPLPNVILSNHMHYCNTLMKTISTGVVSGTASTTKPSPVVYFDPETQTINMKFDSIAVGTDLASLTQFYLPIYPNVLPAVTQANS